MPKNPFSPNKSAVNNPKRNAFDLSFTNHLTFNFGQLIPVMCKEVLPGDTFKIDSAMGLRFMPLAFPIQTKVRAHVHFFYQRAKNVWPGFLDFINGNDKISGDGPLVHPYIDFSGAATESLSNNEYLLQTGSLGDYLGLPTIAYGRYGLPDSPLTKFVIYPTSIGQLRGSDGKLIPLTANLQDSIRDVGLSNFLDIQTGVSEFYYSGISFTGGVWPRSKDNKIVLTIYRDKIDFDPDLCQIVLFRENDGEQFGVFHPIVRNDVATRVLEDGTTYGQYPCYRLEFTLPADTTVNAPTRFSGVICSQFLYSTGTEAGDYSGSGYSYPINSQLRDAVFDPTGNILSNKDYFRVNALPFRVYESIFNAFYRDDRNNPFIIDGKASYNTYLQENGSGPDSTPYMIHNRNWEYDQFTSAVQSPQQGTAPLVGITSLGDVTFSYDGKDYTFSSETADDADTITKINVTENIPTPVARSIVNTVTSGISINDFRNVNAYQRWLETNIRRGLKYKDQTLARWGVQPSDSLLDMPEFIGGYSVDVDVNTVTNVAQSEGNPLGEYAGTASAFGGSNHRISQYCDQHGYIMAIVSVVPVPVYSQLVDKMFLRESALDYYQPEFAQLGLQPITYKELCPLELRDMNQVNEVFGYQRPWYDYIYSNDSAHGLFRSDMSQFLFSRTFYNKPTLNSEFLTVNDFSLNNVFTTDAPHKILGMIRFNIEAHRPIPSVSVPSL